MSRLRPYCELVRLPNVFTAMADVLAGYALAVNHLTASPSLFAALGASSALYSAGIVFNDLADVRVDAVERPGRPLPSGRISTSTARRLAVAMSVIGLALSAVAGPFRDAGGERIVDQGAAIGPALLACILLYDFVAKGRATGPLLMGLCRGLNLLLGASAAAPLPLDRPTPIVGAAFILTLYITSITYFGRQEAESSRRHRLALGSIGLGLSMLLLGALAAQLSDWNQLTMLMWLALAIHLARVSRRAVRSPVPGAVGYAMKTFILSIIVFDALLASAACGWPTGLIVLSLLAPALAIGRRIYST